MCYICIHNADTLLYCIHNADAVAFYYCTFDYFILKSYKIKSFK